MPVCLECGGFEAEDYAQDEEGLDDPGEPEDADGCVSDFFVSEVSFFSKGEEENRKGLRRTLGGYYCLGDESDCPSELIIGFRQEL